MNFHLRSLRQALQAVGFSAVIVFALQVQLTAFGMPLSTTGSIVASEATFGSTVQVQLEAATANAMAMASSGKPLSAAITLQDSLRAVPTNTPSEIDAVLRSMQSLNFVLCALVPNDQLATFLSQSLEPSRYPVDYLIEAYFYRLFQHYSQGRGMPTWDDGQLRLKAKEMTGNPDPLVRAGAFALLASPHWKTPAPIEEYAESMNELALLCPDCDVTYDTFYDLLRVCSGPLLQHPEMVNALLTSELWNPQVQALIQQDPFIIAVSAAVEDTLGDGDATQLRATALGSLTTALTQLPTVSGRDALVRMLATTQSFRRGKVNSIPQDLQNAIGAMASRAEEMRASGQQKVPTDLFRCQFLLFAAAIDDGDVDEASKWYNSMATLQPAAYPLDINFVERVQRKLYFFGNALVMQNRTNEALAVFQAIAQSFPSSWLADQCHISIELHSR